MRAEISLYFVPDCENNINSSNKEEFELQLESLSIHNFKNYQELSIEFKEKIICITGENGSGKTNLLDAIYYLALGKSAFNSMDNQNIKHGEPFFSISGNFELNNEPVSVRCNLKKGLKKILKWNGVEYEKLSEHIGKIPLVMIAPDDSDLVREHSEARRKFVDNIISQVDKEYLQSLIHYNQILKQRNGVLKNLNEQGRKDPTLLEVYDEKLVILAKNIFEKRRIFLKDFRPCFDQHYREISNDKEKASISYKSSLKDPEFSTTFKNNIPRDIFMQRTELGIHRDDFIFKINQYPLKKFGSQGQQKSFLISLKLAQFDFLKSAKNFCPLLLMDDIFDKLDDTRITKMMKWIHNEEFGQIFITDSREKRTREIIKKAGVMAGFLCIRNNVVEPC